MQTLDRGAQTERERELRAASASFGPFKEPKSIPANSPKENKGKWNILMGWGCTSRFWYYTQSDKQPARGWRGEWKWASVRKAGGRQAQDCGQVNHFGHNPPGYAPVQVPLEQTGAAQEDQPKSTRRKVSASTEQGCPTPFLLLLLTIVSSSTCQLLQSQEES